MSVDLGDLVESLKLEISPPGNDLFPTVTDSEFILRLANGFWNARIDGFLPGYVESDGLITPIDVNAPDMPRDLQQVIVFLAAYSTLYLGLLGAKTSFRAKAGAVEYETQQSANLLRELATSLKERYLILLARLSDLGMVPTYVIDGVMARDYSMSIGAEWWVGGGTPTRGINSPSGNNSFGGASW